MKIGGRKLLAMGAALALTGTMASMAQAKGERSFTILVSNVSSENTLRLPDGSASRVPVAPGAYAIVEEGAQIFAGGNRAGAGLERLAEDGMPEAFVAELKKTRGVVRAGMFLHDESFDVVAKPGQRLVFAAMFAQSNDLFYAPDPNGIDLFDGAGKARTGTLADAIALWDAGTEVNEAPGAGPNQAPRQAKPNTGPSEGGLVRPVDDGFAYPSAQEVLELSVTAN